MEIGLYVYYDGKKNNVFQKGLTEYKIGALACEYARLRSADLREIIYSYTHLRAHETPEHLVCRLLLEKKNQITA